MSITFFLLGKKGLTTLTQLHTQFIRYIDCVVYDEDKNVLNDYSVEIKDYCEKNNITCAYRKDFNNKFSALNFAIGWRYIIDTKDAQLIVLHDSLLPKYRGFNPLVTALINGDSTIGVTALFATSEYDKGDIIDQKSIDIVYPIKINDAIEKIAPLYATLVNSIVETFYSTKNITATPQDESKVVYSLWRDDTDYFIDWNNDASYIKRMIDAVGYPYEGAKTKINNETFTITDADVLPNVMIANKTPGKVIWKENNCPVIVCGNGLLKVTIMIDKDKNTHIPNKFKIRFE